MTKQSTKEKPKGLLAPFKDSTGNFHRWAYVLFAIAGLVMIRDVYTLAVVPESDPIRDKEIKMIMNEMMGMGRDIVETSGSSFTLENPDYEYQYYGARVMQKYLLGSQQSSIKMNSDFDNIEERSIDDIELYELNDPAVIEELQISYQKQREILERTYENDIKALEQFIAEVSRLRAQYPDDQFIYGLYQGFVESSSIFEEINEEVMTSLIEFSESINAYLQFLLDNQGKYKFDKDGGFIASSDRVLNEYSGHVSKLQQSVEATEEASSKYLDEMASKLSGLNDLL